MSDHIKTWTATPRAQGKKSAGSKHSSRQEDLFPPINTVSAASGGAASGGAASGGAASGGNTPGNAGGEAGLLISSGGSGKGPRGSRPAPPPRSPGRRLLRCVGLSLLAVLGLVLCVLGWLTSPLGEANLTALTVNMGNKALATSGLRMEIGSVRGLWQGEVRVLGLKLLDKDGLWLHLGEGVVQPRWSKVARNVLDGARMVQKLKLSHDPTGEGILLVQINRATFFDLTVSRPPVLTADSTTPTPPGPLRILPEWLEVDVDELEISRMAYGPEGHRLHANVLANVSFSDTQAEARIGLYISATGQRLKAAPIPEILPDDVTLSRREIEEREAKAQAEAEIAARAAAQMAAEMTNQKSDGQATSTSMDKPSQPSQPSQPSLPGQPSLPNRADTAEQARPGQQGQPGQTGQPGQAGQRPQNLTQHTQLLLNVVWDGVFADIRWQARDTMLLPGIFPGVQRLWSRARVQVNMPQWPPSEAQPVQARMASRFGLTVEDFTERVKASLSSGQLLWDGQKLVVRDVDLQIPIREPRILVQGSAGLSPESGPGMRLRMDLTDLGSLVRALGFKHLEQIVGGEAVGRFAVGRGGRHTLWWTRPLPEPLGFTENPLPGFTAAPLPPELARLEAAGLLNDHSANNGENGTGDNATNSTDDSNDDSSANADQKGTVTASERASVTRTVHDPRASRVATALHTRVSLDSPHLQLPGGTVEGLSLVLRGTSVDADKAPGGTMRRKAVENAARIKGSAGSAGKGSAAAPPNAQGQTEQGQAEQGQTEQGQAPAPKSADSDSDDFAASGLPRGMVGKLELKANSLFGMGDADLAAQWLVAGLHGDADVLLMEFSQLAGKLPGFSLGGDVELSYGLPIRRPWPWLDGTLQVAVDNWQALARLFKSPVQGGGMGLNLRMESRFNEKNEPRQYLRADVQAKLVDAPSFTVNEVRGNVESDHAHALADLFSLAFSPASRRKVSPDGPPPLDYDLLKVRLQLGSGAGGPLQWSSGLCNLHVAGEDARIDANLKGNIRGTLEGIFNFRKRVLQIQKMEVSQGEGVQTMALRLQNPLKATLHEDGALEPVDVGLTYGTAPEATARLKASLHPMNAAGARQNMGDSLVDAPVSPPIYRILQAEATLWGLPGQNAAEADSPSALRATLALPLLFAPLPALPALLEGGPLSGEARWQGQLEPLWKLLPLPGRHLRGEAHLLLGLSGSLAKPLLRASASLDKGQYVDKLEGLRLQDMALRMDYGGRDLSHFSLSAADGRGGTLALAGTLFQQNTAPMVNAAGSLQRLRPLHRDDLRLTLSGDLTLRGPLLGTSPPTALSAAPLPPPLLLSGTVRLDEGSFQLLQGFTPSVASLDPVSAGSAPPPLSKEWLQQAGFALAQASTDAAKESAQGRAGNTAAKGKGKAAAKTASETQSLAVSAAVTNQTVSSAATAVKGAAATPTAWVTPVPELQLSLVAPGRFFISGKGLDSEWRADLKVLGSARAPQLTGSLSPVRGTFELLNRQFRFDKGGIHFSGAWPPNPTLDLALGYQSAQITALVEVQGSAKRPRLNLTSQPPLPRDEVMAQVLFGKSLGSLSRFETLQAANAARQLADAGPSALDVLSDVKDMLGLQVLRLGSGSAASTAKSAPRDASMQGKSTEGQDLGTTLEAGKYITDSVYVGVEQGTKAEAGTAVRVEVELTPNISLSGRTSQESSGVGLNWKMDY